MIEEIQLSAKFPYMYFYSNDKEIQAPAEFPYHTYFSPIIQWLSTFNLYIFTSTGCDPSTLSDRGKLAFS